MPCTTILVGKNASYDGSTLSPQRGLVQRVFEPKRMRVVHPDEQRARLHERPESPDR
ncbi:MAG: C69 family dipeptidase [Collinsella sp.]